MSLTDAQVTAIRTERLTDNHWARKLRTTNGTIRRARTGVTYRHVPTPPDTAPREGGMPHWQIKAKPARVRRSYFDDQPTHRGITP
jgi:hypothetical protein